MTSLAALGLAVIVALSTPPVQAQVSFLTTQTFAAGDFPFSITVGDLDGDGDLDLTTANSSSSYPYPSSVSVLKNNGNATFAALQYFAVGDYPSSITVGDLDKDGDLDLAAANYFSDNVTVLQNSTPTLQLSPSPNRSNLTPLEGQSGSGNIYVFASGKDTDFKRVKFFLDDPDKSGEPIRLEQAAPFDFAGGTNMDPT
ncbi:MAG: VCBS repeat-containing protein, partial [Gemmatimonadaceae bacterium]|nr:VCBS repeat-containing protein [Gloeobacterales cyanobacterium ES-bin-141]